MMRRRYDGTHADTEAVEVLVAPGHLEGDAGRAVSLYQELAVPEYAVDEVGGRGASVYQVTTAVAGTLDRIPKLVQRTAESSIDALLEQDGDVQVAVFASRPPREASKQVSSQHARIRGDRFASTVYEKQPGRVPYATSVTGRPRAPEGAGGAYTRSVEPLEVDFEVVGRLVA